MVRLAVSVNLPTPPEPTRNLARTFDAINAAVSGVNVQCSNCRERGRVNSKLLKRGQKFVCGSCVGAS